MKRIALALAVSLAVGGSAFAGKRAPAPNECMTLDKLRGQLGGAKLTPLNISQFYFVLGAFDGATPPHTPLPDADNAAIAIGKAGVVLWMKGKCLAHAQPMPVSPEIVAHLQKINPIAGENSDAPDDSQDLHL